MDAISTQKFIRMSPTKLRLVADMVRGKSTSEVLMTLPFVQKEAAGVIRKVIRSAVANAEVKGANPAELVIKAIEIGEGPRLKRFRPVSRGQAHGYVRKMSHIKVMVATNSENQKPKVEANPEVKPNKSEKKAKKGKE